MYFTGALFRQPVLSLVLLANDTSDFDPLIICFYLGIVLLVACFAMLLSPLRDKISGATQKIQGFGLNLEVSVLTLLFLISAALISSGIWVKLGSIKDQLMQAMEDKKAAELKVKNLDDAMRNIQRTSVEAFVTLDGVPDVRVLKTLGLKCEYYTSATDDPDQCTIAKGVIPSQVKITFKEMNKITTIRGIEITESDAPKRRWTYRNPAGLDPFRQNLNLNLEKPS